MSASGSGGRAKGRPLKTAPDVIVFVVGALCCAVVALGLVTGEWDTILRGLVVGALVASIGGRP